jgi:hypothetical protein
LVPQRKEKEVGKMMTLTGEWNVAINDAPASAHKVHFPYGFSGH